MTWQEEAREAVDLGLDQLLLSPMSRGEVLDGIEHRLADVVAAEVARGKVAALREAQGKIKAAREDSPAAVLSKPQQAAWKIGMARAHGIVRADAIEAEAGER